RPTPRGAGAAGGRDRPGGRAGRQPRGSAGGSGGQPAPRPRRPHRGPRRPRLVERARRRRSCRGRGVTSERAVVAPDWFATALAQAPEELSAEVAGAKLEVLAWGERGRPGLLFLHGNGAHARWWSLI